LPERVPERKCTALGAVWETDRIPIFKPVSTRTGKEVRCVPRPDRASRYQVSRQSVPG
jgi:hypothetical protein